MKKALGLIGVVVIILLTLAVPFIVYGTGAYIAIHFIKKFW